MIEITSIKQMEALVGQEIGTSDWLKIDQGMINAFAAATGDHQWIHVDTSRAAASAFGTTIVHGFFLLSLLPRLKAQLVEFKLAAMAINYGSEKIRFLAPVPVNARVRLKTKLLKIEEGTSGIKLFTKNNLELEGSEKDALVAETITLLMA
ncbi:MULTISPECIES: MaoC family dehydratase [unclassified Imperialibacter]|uniref:MaoC family dehydratase n=1 Tax=unclassified Imperialibacter TaxID=2629706 RepID=UPI0012513C88|nr:MULTISPECIES: MaoC family dehydratase [unclassified Imperialibacter]CAD5278142.1 putative enoyl-CoA hydratase 1 [Imperialibacter sp. 75]CAD5295907.1 putative enoyl-CoA hydratase 1 [Imperialibacter sp. 89]VVT11667.1 putative enoyl-CoA hydratase 1 [Imperialibacter sp. EC-SDR9]